MSLLLAIMPGTRLRLFANRRWQLLELDVGDVLVFAGDVKHNGVGYAAEHLRIHAHLYPPGTTMSVRSSSPKRIRSPASRTASGRAVRELCELCCERRTAAV